jgi:hypothetical protein
MLSLGARETLSSIDEEHIKQQYETSVEFLKALADYSMILLLFSLLRLTTFEIGIMVMNGLTFMMIYLASKERNLCLMFLSVIFSLFWLFFYVMKIIKNFTLLIDPNFNLLFFIWVMLLDFLFACIFIAMIVTTLKGYLRITIILYYEAEKSGNLKENVNTNLLKNEEEKNNGTI